MQVEGDTPLHKACRGGDLRQVVQLIRAGADVEAFNQVSLHATTAANFFSHQIRLLAFVCVILQRNVPQ
jgi:hypothetical protein